MELSFSIHYNRIWVLYCRDFLDLQVVSCYFLTWNHSKKIMSQISLVCSQVNNIAKLQLVFLFQQQSLQILLCRFFSKICQIHNSSTRLLRYDEEESNLYSLQLSLMGKWRCGMEHYLYPWIDTIKLFQGFSTIAYNLILVNLQ